MARDHQDIRQIFIVSARQLQTIALALRRAAEQLPEVPEAVLALAKPADTASTLRLAVDHLEEELPELVRALIEAARCTPQSLKAAHKAYLSRTVEPERALAPPRGEIRPEDWKP